jgi:hypothetical protein
MTVTHILTILSSSDIVVELKIIDINIEPPIQSLKAKAILKNGYVLQVTESIGIDFRRYSYHLQKGDMMVKRWDNAPHWKSIKTFPHHVHIQNDVKPIESREVFIEDILQYLIILFQNNTG